MATVGAWYDPGQNEPIPLTDEASVEALLDRMEAEAVHEDVRVMADVHYRGDDGEAVLQVGLGFGSGFVGYSHGAVRVISSGTVTDAADVVFDFQTHERAVPASSLVDIHAVRRVVHVFVGAPLQRPDGIVHWSTV